MSVSLDRGTSIGRLRLRAATADPDALRMRGGTAVGALDLQPPAMPEQAILCIRTLQDPLPGGLDLRFSAAPRPVAWETAMRGAVAGALRRAVRPALGPVPAEADAVRFAHRSELLACAARGAFRRALPVHWGWTGRRWWDGPPGEVAPRRAPALARSERFAAEAVTWIESERRRGVPVTIRPIGRIRPIRPMKADRTDPLRIAAVQGEAGKSSAAPDLEQPAARRP